LVGLFSLQERNISFIKSFPFVNEITSQQDCMFFNCNFVYSSIFSVAIYSLIPFLTIHIQIGNSGLLSYPSKNDCYLYTRYSYLTLYLYHFIILVFAS